MPANIPQTFGQNKKAAEAAFKYVEGLNLL
jgi:hypothetical protein